MPNVSTGVLAKGRVVPEDVVALSVFTFGCFGWFRDKENIKKEMCRIFNYNGLCITIEANKEIINFLGVTFNLNRSTY